MCNRRPFDASRSREIVTRMQDIPKILSDGEANLRAVRPFAQLAIEFARDRYGPNCWRWSAKSRRCCSEARCNPETSLPNFGGRRKKQSWHWKTYRAWLQEHLQEMPENAAVGRANYEFFLSHVALIPYTPEQLLAISRQEWERAVTFEQIEKQRNQGLPELKIAASIDEQIRTSERDELGDSRIFWRRRES